MIAKYAATGTLLVAAAAAQAASHFEFGGALTAPRHDSFWAYPKRAI